MRVPPGSAEFDIEASWVINLVCNYGCDYCISSAAKDPPLTRRLNPQRAADFLNSTGKRWLLHLTGGEPFMHPGFVQLCALLTRQHLISINSNLTMTRRIAEFVDTVDPARVEYIHCGVHPEERNERKGWGGLTRNLERLVKAGFPTFASCIMTPAAFAHYEQAEQTLAAVGVPLLPKMLQLSHEGRWYPQAYTDRERSEFLRLSEIAEIRAHANPHRPLRNHPTETLANDRRYLGGVPDFSRVMCSAGRTFVTIAPDGNIYACGHSRRLGNIFLEKLNLLQSDQPCQAYWCYYICVRHSAVDLDAAEALPVRTSEVTLRDRIQHAAYALERGAVNSLVQLTLR